MPRLLLCDRDPEVVGAWKAQFVKWPEVEIVEGDPLGAPGDALLLPGNSFGFLDSGLELRVVETFGWSLQDELRRRIRQDFDGELLVGQAVVLRLSSLSRPIVYAPLWRTPGPLAHSVNVLLAVRGAFLALKKDAGAPPLSLLCAPALGVGVPGDLDPRISARQIRYAYEMACGQRGLGDKNLSQLGRRQRKLQSVPGAAAGQAGREGEAEED